MTQGRRVHIRSMTGFGQGSAEVDGLAVTVQLRTVNNRFADLRFRLPPSLVDLEPDIRRRILARVKRGRVEMTLNVERNGQNGTVPSLNRTLLGEILGARQVLREDFGITGTLDLGALMAVPGLFRSDSRDIDWTSARRESLTAALDSALQALDEDRCREGRVLMQDCLKRVEAMVGLTSEMRTRAEALPPRLRDRVEERLKALSGDIELEPARVAQEAVYLAERSDVTEEIVRLEGHLEQTRTLLSAPDGDPVGKRLEFLLQELNREANTVNSKSADLELSRSALAFKSECERVREQVLNLE